MASTTATACTTAHPDDHAGGRRAIALVCDDADNDTAAIVQGRPGRLGCQQQFPVSWLIAGCHIANLGRLDIRLDQIDLALRFGTNRHLALCSLGSYLLPSSSDGRILPAHALPLGSLDDLGKLTLSARPHPGDLKLSPSLDLGDTLLRLYQPALQAAVISAPEHGHQ